MKLEDLKEFEKDIIKLKSACYQLIGKYRLASAKLLEEQLFKIADYIQEREDNVFNILLMDKIWKLNNN